MRPDVVIQGIEKQEWLKPAETGLKEGLDRLFEPDTAAGKPIQNFLHGVWLGHAVHPVLTDIPVGAWTVACVLDLIEDTTGTRQYSAGADAALNIGLIGAVGAAVTGVTDWKDISQEARRTGLVHGILNGAATVLYAASAIQRARRNRGAARALSYAGYALAFGSAWLGGHLVYANRVAVEHNASDKVPSGFVPLLPADALHESKPHRAEHEGYSILLVKKGAKIFALSEKCTHLGGPLSEGTVEGDCIRCPWHGSLFSLETGAVKESPATRPQAVFEARVREGQVEVRVRTEVGAETGTPSEA